MKYLFAISYALAMNGLVGLDFWMVAFMTAGAVELGEYVFGKIYATQEG